MLDSIQQTLEFFGQYKYEALFPAAFLEGPAVSIIAGFLASSGVLKILPSLVIVYLGDICSDIIFYFLGSQGKIIINKTKFIKISENQTSKIDNQYDNNPWRTMIIAKVAYGLGIAFMVVAGISKMPFKSFLKYISILNAIRSTILFFSGYYFGKVALHFGPRYLHYYSFGIVFIFSIWVIIAFNVKKNEEKYINRE